MRKHPGNIKLKRENETGNITLGNTDVSSLTRAGKAKLLRVLEFCRR